MESKLNVYMFGSVQTRINASNSCSVDDYNHDRNYQDIVDNSTYELGIDSKILTNYDQLIKDLNGLVAQFRESGNVFSLWISVSLVTNATVFLFFFVSIWSQWFLSCDTCQSQNYLSLLHYFVTFLFSIIALMLVLEAMAYNHRILRLFQINFAKRVIVTSSINLNVANDSGIMNDDDNQVKDNCKIETGKIILAMQQHQRIMKYLEYLVEHQSPFRICSMTPTYVNLTRLFVLAFATFAFNIGENYISFNLN